MVATIFWLQAFAAVNWYHAYYTPQWELALWTYFHISRSTFQGGFLLLCCTHILVSISLLSFPSFFMFYLTIALSIMFLVTFPGSLSLRTFLVNMLATTPPLWGMPIAFLLCPAETLQFLHSAWCMATWPRELSVDGGFTLVIFFRVLPLRGLGCLFLWLAAPRSILRTHPSWVLLLCFLHPQAFASIISPYPLSGFSFSNHGIIPCHIPQWVSMPSLLALPISGLYIPLWVSMFSPSVLPISGSALSFPGSCLMFLLVAPYFIIHGAVCFPLLRKAPPSCLLPSS